ncbi:MAG: hypothetical protein JSR59_05015 [Proteobacteria bacterium]|nr:hypothetical protein [Pseudomonadota bacterium]
MHRPSTDPAAAPSTWPRVAGAVAVALLLVAAARAISGSTAGSLLLALLLLAVAVAALVVSWQVARRLTDALRDARQRLAHYDELLDVWQWRTDREHRVVACSPPGGRGAAAALGMPLWEMFKARDGAVLRAELDRHAPLDAIDGQHAAAGGTARTARLHGRAQRDALGAFDGYVGIVRDVDAATPPTRAVAAPAPAATAPLPATTEHESFSYTVSHDLRAPIRVVEGFTKIVKEDYGRLLDRVGNDHLDRVLGAAARMNGMIDALLALSKLSSQPLARQPVNLSQLASYVADDLKRQWPERKVTLSIEPGLQAVGDPTLLRVVLENLLGNAWKYTGKNPDAHVWLERCADQPEGYTVRDDGAGFDMRFAERLFGVFQRLHSANDFPGTGVGLASVQRIVRRHGGTIWGEGEVNRGARFHFTLPSDAAA